VHSQVNNVSGSNDRSPSTLIPIEAEGFHAYVDAFALDGQWVCIPMKSAPIPKQIGNPRSRSEATLGFCS